MLKENITIALAGNPNVGKSTVFNNLTGLRQHTGNWTGKTVENAKGVCVHNGRKYGIMDIPGIYSVMSCSPEEELARDFICFDRPDVTVIVADATALERNLNLVVQIMEITDNVILCLNLMDEAKSKKIVIDVDGLGKILGVPVVPITATKKSEAFKVLDAVEDMLGGKNSEGAVFKMTYRPEIEEAIAEISGDIERICGSAIESRFIALKVLGCERSILDTIESRLGLRLFDDAGFAAKLESVRERLAAAGLDEAAFVEEVVTEIINACEGIAAQTVTFLKPDYNEKNRKIDRILTSKLFGIPIMLAMLGVIFFITILFSNYPSGWLSSLFRVIEKSLNAFLRYARCPEIIRAPLMDGVFRTTAWVVAVMLPPMTIFFPLFTLLEDLGYLPRVAFNLDKPFKKCGCCGKQCLTMCMGFGCNAVGVTGTRIIDSPRERMAAILTNCFVPCNGRFPTLITVSVFFVGGTVANSFVAGAVAALVVTAAVLAGIAATFAVSAVLTHTLLKGKPSGFRLELPPFRKPQVGKIIVRSLFDRTLLVLLRAVSVAAPCGLIIWILANVSAGSQPLLAYVVSFFEPLARLMGMDGSTLAAFVLGFPANEIVMPIAVMNYTAAGSLVEIGDTYALGNLLAANGWTVFTAISVLIFCLFHFPCATTCLTIKKETKSKKWTALAILLPTAMGIALCMIFTAAVRLFGMI